ncbi:His-Xaa-Ser system radical SAM maturase HxsC [Shewanella dokdonensis]|uniref:His-Xaa-Ser system radical SAM maturase HxsC n=1 Tax=Shewanella dokdonensis TaxID=712036 RepID=UPI00200E2A35|nr:His-Xaa-Ser system radical SAM maturase HxsC [Shewanella dokdonensis]MCL1073107.1 His-Xaa-Ser system radical SAM maturase HxsC [Shewanella dokdonensis]
MDKGIPLKTRAEVKAFSGSRMLKVLGLDEFVSTGTCNDRYCLFLPTYDVSQRELLTLGWGAVVIQSGEIIPTNLQIPVICKLEYPEIIATGDVIVFTENRVDILYRRRSASNLLFVTEQCNHKCIMCSQPPRNLDDDWRIDECHKLLELIDSNIPILGISGGEPTLARNEFLSLLKHAKKALPSTLLHILTNGTAFEDYRYVNEIVQLGHQQILWGVPIYGSTPQMHDYHTQIPGSFNRVMHGLYNLGHVGAQIELRIVLTRPVIENIIEISEFIARNLPFVTTVALMGIEPTGYARTNYKAVWCDLNDYQEELREGTQVLLRSGLDTVLYNIPRCHVPKSLRSIAVQSISDWKNSYRNECEHCEEQHLCGGFFKSHTQRFSQQKVKPIQLERRAENDSRT